MKDVTRVTLVLPRKLWEEVKQMVPSGQRSRLVAKALEAEILRRKQWEAFERARQLGDELLEKYGELPSSVEEIYQMREGRDVEITGLR
jgi:metal-responsive CopG/Arc/MetJ family transcriptional regulator